MALLMGAMLLSLGILGSKMMIKQVEFSSNLLLSTRAHYAAESGVERALYALKEFPVRYLQDAPIVVGHLGENEQTTAAISIDNKSTDFEAKIPAHGNIKLRLFRDNSGNYNGIDYRPTNPDTWRDKEENVIDVHVSNNSGTEYHWKILCDDGSGGTASYVNPIAHFTGNITPADYSTFMASHEHCFLTLENLSPTELSLRISSPSTMPPAATRVKVEGVAQGKTKVVEFDYRQKNLGGLFDFTLFHQGG